MNRVTVKTGTNNYITFKEGVSPRVLGEPRDKKITDCVVSKIYDDRSEEYGLCDSDYMPEGFIDEEQSG